MRRISFNLTKAVSDQLDAANERIAELEAEVLVWKRHWKDLNHQLLTLQASLRCKHCGGTGLTLLRMPIHGERDEVFQGRCAPCNGTGITSTSLSEGGKIDMSKVKVGDEVLVLCRVVEIRDAPTNWKIRVALNGQTDEALDEQGNVRNEAVIAVVLQPPADLV